MAAACAREVERVGALVTEASDAAFEELARAVRRLGRLERVRARIEAWNARVAAKRAMLADGDWRARVRLELGGAEALRRWERRAARCAEVRGGAGHEPGGDGGGVPQEAARRETTWLETTWGETTWGEPGRQELGREAPMFRLPALPRARRSGRGAARQNGVGRGGARMELAPVSGAARRVERSIPVWPDELRGRAARRRAASRRAANRQAAGGTRHRGSGMDGGRFHTEARAMPTAREFGPGFREVLQVAAGPP